MRGDFSRIRFNRAMGYTAVLEQQGRVALDADSNEQRFIDEYLRTIETVDVIGEYGAPTDDAGFGITVTNNGEILIGRGRYYVNGLLCENDQLLEFEKQPHLIVPGLQSETEKFLKELEEAKGRAVLQVYLEVWERLVTVLDDSCLREPALGQADTTARLQTVWRVNAHLASTPEQGTGKPPGVSPCCQVMYENTSAQSTGSMTATTAGSSSDCGCQPVATAGYQGVENQLYRVEIHQGGDEQTATFKWSRENGSIVSAVTSYNGNTVQLSSLGPDANLGFGPEQWVELIDDDDLFGATPNQPGTLHKIQTVQPADPSVTLYDNVTQLDTARNARLRRWDQTGTSPTNTGIPLSAGTSIPLENGIEICFAAGQYQAGDYWSIAARTATGTIEWPPCGSDGSAYQPPHSNPVFRAPLACIHVNTNRKTQNGLFTVDDCRLLFNPLTELAAPTAPSALHVKEISWVNDDVATFDQLVADGLTVELDQAPSGPITGGNFIVTVESPDLQFGDLGESNFTGAAEEGGGAVTILRDPAVIDSEITVDGATISWQLPFQQAGRVQKLTVGRLDQLISGGAVLGEFARVRVRLLGDKIFAASSTGAIFLDGRTFGKAAVRADGTTARIDLQLPSGDGGRTSDLEGWFYLAPILTIDSMTADPDAVTVVVDANNNVTSLQNTGDGSAVAGNPTVTVYLNYPPLAATTMALTLTSNTDAANVASIPGSVEVAAQQSIVSFPIDVVGNPGANTTVTFTITASLPSAIDISIAQNVTFTVTGAQPPASSRPRPPERPILPVN